MKKPNLLIFSLIILAASATTYYCKQARPDPQLDTGIPKIRIIKWPNEFEKGMAASKEGIRAEVTFTQSKDTLIIQWASGRLEPYVMEEGLIATPPGMGTDRDHPAMVYAWEENDQMHISTIKPISHTKDH